MLRLSLPRLILTGLILSALPAASLTRQSLAKTSSTVISQNRPVRLSEDTISLRGIVTDRNENTIAVDYLFETISAQKGLAKLLTARRYCPCTDFRAHQ